MEHDDVVQALTAASARVREKPPTRREEEEADIYAGWRPCVWSGAWGCDLLGRTGDGDGFYGGLPTLLVEACHP